MNHNIPLQQIILETIVHRDHHIKLQTLCLNGAYFDDNELSNCIYFYPVVLCFVYQMNCYRLLLFKNCRSLSSGSKTSQNINVAVLEEEALRTYLEWQNTTKI